MNPEPCTVSRVLIDIDGGKVRTKVQLPTRKETKTVKHRDFDPANPCLPPEVYPHLWATLLANPRQSTPSLWDRITSAFRRVQAALPVLVAATFLPLADPPAHQLQRVVYTGGGELRPLVWEQPAGVRPKTLPIAEGNPYSF